MKSKHILTFISLAFVSCSYNKPALLRLRYTKGDELTYIFQQKTLDNDEIRINTETEIKFTVDSVNIKDHTFAFVVNLVGIKTNNNLFDKDEQYDSRKKNSEMSAEELKTDALYAKALGENYTLKLDSRGIIMDPFQDWGGKLTEAPVDMKVLQLEFPEQPVKIGYHWTTKRMNPILNSENTYTYTIDKINDKEIVVSISAILPLRPFAKDATQQVNILLMLKMANYLQVI